MTAYAIAHMREVTMGPGIVEYLERIEQTLAPHGGQFAVHGADVEAMEGVWPGTIVVIAFPDKQRAAAWYASEAYQAILPLRTENAVADVIIVDGVDADHRATDVLGAAAS
ncbi:DUF1330 domain-containing protein [Mumia sp. Pv 4-285]|uniref:DUF1330 domain-containing protein n=1 Tax=Mumia qirimensis TaxID=3234852 RepID=UPI00351D0055